MQWLLAHSPALEQAWPFAFGPQLPFTHACPLTQSASLAQRLMHAPSAHRNGEQFCAPGGRQLPTPLQILPLTVVAELHCVAPQLAPYGT